MPHHKNLTPTICHTQINTRLLRLRQHQQFLTGMDILIRYCRMPAVRSQENIVKSPYQRHSPVHNPVLKQTKQFTLQQMFTNTEMMIQPCLGAPTDMKCGSYMLFGPVHNLTQFLPVIHLTKINLFHRCAGDNHTVELPLTQFIKSIVKVIQMGNRCMKRHMAVHLHKRNMNL